MEQLITVLDITSTLLFSTALFFAFRLTHEQTKPSSKLFLLLSIGVYILVGISNILEHAQITSYFDQFEDYLELLFIPFLLFFFFSLYMEQQLDELVRAQKALKLYEDIAENMQNGLHVYHLETIHDDKTLRMIAVNPAAAAATGIAVNEMVGRTLDENFPGLRDKGIPQAYAEVVRSEKPVTFEDIYYEDDRVLSGAFSVKAFPLPNQCVGVTFENITERRKTEEALQQAALVIENSPAILFRWQAAEGWPVQLVSDNVIQFGYTPDELLNGTISFSSMIHPDDLERVENEVVDHSNMGTERFQQEYRILTKGGQVRWIDDRTHVERDSQGRITHYQGVIVDITKRKLAEEALRESEKKFRSIVENALAGIFTVNENYQFVYANDKLCQILGYLEKDLLGMDFRDVLSKESKAIVADRYIRRQRGESVTPRYELSVVRRDGAIRQAEMSVTVVTDASGKPRSMGQLVDITERKQTEEALQQSERHLRLLTDNMADVICQTDAQLEIVFASPSLERVFGYLPQEIIGKTATDWVHPDDLPLTLEVAANARNNMGNSVRLVYRWRHANGDYLWVESATRLLYDEQGQSAGAIFSSRDITDRKQAEKEVHRLNEELEQRVRERTKQLEAANTELEAFSYSVSHDLRTPLRAIDGYTRILVEDYESILDEEGQRVCAVIRRQTRLMSELIDHLLAFSRLGRTDIRPSPIDMSKLARDVFYELATPEEQARASIQIASLPPAVGDEKLIHQVWQNLLANALKFTGKRERVMIEIGFKQDGGQNTYFVRDNGVGFDMQYANKLFGVFQRLHKETDFPGTGVGLAIVQRIIHRHGGQIWAEGEVEQGATFYFTLPSNMIKQI